MNKHITRIKIKDPVMSRLATSAYKQMLEDRPDLREKAKRLNISGSRRPPAGYELVFSNDEAEVSFNPKTGHVYVYVFDTEELEAGQVGPMG